MPPPAASANLVVVDGTKTDGVDSLFKACRKIIGDVPSITKDHGRIFWFSANDAFSEWAAPSRGKVSMDMSQPLACFRMEPSIRVLRCWSKRSLIIAASHGRSWGGWGYLSRAVLGKEGVASLDLIEAEALSLDCARQNVTDDRATFLWEDATTYVPPQPYDGIVMNPPFHTGAAPIPRWAARLSRRRRGCCPAGKALDGGEPAFAV